MAKGKTIAGFDELADEELKGDTIDEITSTNEQEGDDEEMTKGKEGTKHNLVEMEGEVTVTIGGIADLFKEVHEDGTEDQDIIDQLTPKNREEIQEILEKEESVSVEAVHLYRAELIAKAFPVVAQELVDKQKKGKELPDRDKIKKKVINEAANIAMDDPKAAKTINESGGIKVFKGELMDTFKVPVILDKYEKLIDHLIFMSEVIAKEELEKDKKASAVKEVEKPEADKPKEPVREVEKPEDKKPVEEPKDDEVVEEEPVLLFTKSGDKPKEEEKPEAEKPKEAEKLKEEPAAEAAKPETDEEKEVREQKELAEVINKVVKENDQLSLLIEAYAVIYPDVEFLLEDIENIAEITLFVIKKRFQPLIEKQPELKSVIEDDKMLIDLVANNVLYTFKLTDILHDVMKVILPPSAYDRAEPIRAKSELIFAGKKPDMEYAG